VSLCRLKQSFSLHKEIHSLCPQHYSLVGPWFLPYMCHCCSCDIDLGGFFFFLAVWVTPIRAKDLAFCLATGLLDIALRGRHE